VVTPTLTGFGERVPLATPAIGLETPIQAIVNILHGQDLHAVVLACARHGGPQRGAIALDHALAVRDAPARGGRHWARDGPHAPSPAWPTGRRSRARVGRRCPGVVSVARAVVAPGAFT
jgi:hypothetical protein